MSKFVSSSKTNVYFHMTNHYKKLKLVKSVVDTSSPAGYYEKQSRPPFRSEHRRETNQNDKYAMKIRKDKFKNSSNSSSSRKHETPRNNFIRSASVPARPPTRRRFFDMPTSAMCPQRAKSSGPFSKEESNIPNLRLSRSNRSSRYNSPSNSSTPRSSNQPHSNSSRIKSDNHKAILNPPTPAPRKKKRRLNGFQTWFLEHEYMEFMLRITEDIIQNNLYTPEEILQVLNSHIEANVEKLSVPKMIQQIRILCYELNVPFERIVIGNANIKAEFMEPLESIEKNSICTCNSVLADNNKHDFGDCECATKRSSPFQCVIHNGKSEIHDFLKMNQDFSPSQNIIETYYFKNAKDSANSKQTTSINNNESNDQQGSTNILVNQHSLSCVPELSEYSESSEVTTVHSNKPQAPQPPQKSCTTSPKTTVKHKHPCNCNKSKQWQFHTHTKFNKSPNGDEQSIQTKIENSVNNTSKQVTENVFYIGCPCSNPTETPSILPGPLDYVFCCTNAQHVLQHMDNKHQVTHIHESGTNELFAFKNTDTRQNQNEISPLKDVKIYHMPVTQKNHFCHRKENFHDPDEEFILSLGNAYMPTSVSSSNNRSLFENVCVVAPDATDKGKFILLKNLIKKGDPTIIESNGSSEISDLNSSYILEAARVNTKKMFKNNETNLTDKCGTQLSTVGTMTTSKCSSQVVHDNNTNLTYKSCGKATKDATERNNKNIYLIVPDDVKHDQIFVVRKSQFEKLDNQSGISHENEFQILKEIEDISQSSFMPSCMANMHGSGYHSSEPSNSAYKIKRSINLNNIGELQFIDKTIDPINMATSSKSIDSKNTASTAVDKTNLKKFQMGNNSFSSNNSFLSSRSSTETKPCNTNNCNSKVLLKLNDYDLTPQRDNNSNVCDTSNKRISFSQDSKSFEFEKDKLLLGNEYEINKSSTSIDYSKGIPDCIKQFYPNIASQTGPSDYLSDIKSRSEPSITKGYDLEHTFNSNYNTDNPDEIKSKSQSSSILSEYPKEEEDQIVGTIKHQITDLQLDLMLDFELNSEEQSLKKLSLPKQTNVVLDTSNNLGDDDSSSSSILNELLVYNKLNNEIEEPRSLTFRQSQRSVEIITENVDDDKNEDIIIKKPGNEIILQPTLKHVQRASHGNSSYTDSQLLLLFDQDRKVGDNKRSQSKESPYQIELNQLIEKSKENSDVGNSPDLEKELNQGLSTPVSAQENKNLFDNIDGTEKDDNGISKIQNKKTSLSKSSKTNTTNPNVAENDQQFEKSSLKPLENKVSTHSSQRRVLIKENIVERKESSVPYISSRHDSVPIQLPIIEIEPSDTKLNTNNKRNSSSDSTQTYCCGLKTSKAKVRRDVIEVDKNLQTIPNISSIPDDQLFEVEMRRPTMAGYGAERKSLRFDYSMMSELSNVGGEKPTDDTSVNPSTEKRSIDNSTLSKAEQGSSNVTDTKSSKADTKSENSSLVIDIYKPAREESSVSLMLDSSYLKEKNNGTDNL